MFEYSSLIAIGCCFSSYDSLAVIILILAGLGLVGCRYIPHNRVGVIEKLWSPKGSLKGGRIVASHEEAGLERTNQAASWWRSALWLLPFSVLRSQTATDHGRGRKDRLSIR